MSASTAQPSPAAAQQAESTSQAEVLRSISILMLPFEVRLIIYRLLFVNLIVTVRRAHEEPSEGPWNIMRTCQLFHTECLQIFYDFATIKLHHELFLHLLRAKIGPQNLARIRSLAIAGFKDTIGRGLAAQLPVSLKRLNLIWEGGTLLSHTTPKGHLSDGDIKSLLGVRRRQLDSIVKQIWSHNHGLQIYLDTYVGNAPSPKVCGSIVLSSPGVRKGATLGNNKLMRLVQDAIEVQKRQRYVYLRVELVRQIQEGWSWGPIKRIVDQSMVKQGD